MIRFVLSILCLAGVVWNQALEGNLDHLCAAASNGKVIRVHCWGFVTCFNQTAVVMKCPDGQVLERDSMSCKLIGMGNTICGTSIACTGTGYLPSPNCQSFFFCSDGVFLENSHIYCPGNLLFDGTTCNFAQLAPLQCQRYLPGK